MKDLHPKRLSQPINARSRMEGKNSNSNSSWIFQERRFGGHKLPLRQCEESKISPSCCTRLGCAPSGAASHKCQDAVGFTRAFPVVARFCARGWAHSGSVVHPSDLSVRAQPSTLSQRGYDSLAHEWPPSSKNRGRLCANRHPAGKICSQLVHHRPAFVPNCHEPFSVIGGFP